MTKKISVIGMLIAAAFIFSYLETLVPLNLPFPGVKLGLANIIVIFSLYKYGVREAFLICLVKIVISGLSFGGVNMMLFSLCGGLLSFVVMVAARWFLSIEGVSVLGAVFHNVGQIICAAVVYSTVGIVTYLPILLIAGVVTGIVIGIVSRIAVERIKL